MLPPYLASLYWISHFAGEKKEEELPTLDTYLGKSTSEDNASFNQIMDLADEKNRIKHAWLYEAEELSNQVQSPPWPSPCK